MMKSLKIITPKVENSMAQCEEAFAYLKRQGLDESTFRDYVRINEKGDIRVGTPRGRIGRPDLRTYIALPIATILHRDKQTEALLNLVERAFEENPIQV